MINFLSFLVILCASLIVMVANGFLAPVLSGFVLASGLRPILNKFPLNKIESKRIRRITGLLLFLTAFSALTTYVVIASARGIARNVEFKQDGEIRGKDSDEGVVAVEVDSQLAFKEQEDHSKKNFTDKVKGVIEKIPGMNAEEVTRTWGEVLSRARSMAFAFLSKILTAGPAIFVQWVVFLMSFIMIFWNYESLIAGLRQFQKRFREVEDCIEFFENSTQATLIGTLVVGFAQGSIVSLGAAIAGFESFILLGLCAFFASFVPFFGTALVWISALIYSLVNGDTQAAIIVGVTGCISSVADNLILPTFVGSQNRVHPLLLFIVVLGMIDLVGIWGLFLGPVLAIFSTRVFELWFVRFTSKPAH